MILTYLWCRGLRGRCMHVRQFDYVDVLVLELLLSQAFGRNLGFEESWEICVAMGTDVRSERTDQASLEKLSNFFGAEESVGNSSFVLKNVQIYIFKFFH